MGVSPKIGENHPNHPILRGFSIIFTIHFWCFPLFLETFICLSGIIWMIERHSRDFFNDFSAHWLAVHFLYTIPASFLLVYILPFSCRSICRQCFFSFHYCLFKNDWRVSIHSRQHDSWLRWLRMMRVSHFLKKHFSPEQPNGMQGGKGGKSKIYVLECIQRPLPQSARDQGTDVWIIIKCGPLKCLTLVQWPFVQGWRSIDGSGFFFACLAGLLYISYLCSMCLLPICGAFAYMAWNQEVPA